MVLHGTALRVYSNHVHAIFREQDFSSLTKVQATEDPLTLTQSGLIVNSKGSVALGSSGYLIHS